MFQCRGTPGHGIRREERTHGDQRKSLADCSQGPSLWSGILSEVPTPRCPAHTASHSSQRNRQGDGPHPSPNQIAEKSQAADDHDVCDHEQNHSKCQGRGSILRRTLGSSRKEHGEPHSNQKCSKCCTPTRSLPRARMIVSVGLRTKGRYSLSSMFVSHYFTMRCFIDPFTAFVAGSKSSESNSPPIHSRMSSCYSCFLFQRPDDEAEPLLLFVSHQLTELCFIRLTNCLRRPQSSFMSLNCYFQASPFLLA